MKAKQADRMEKLKQSLENRKQRDEAALEQMNLKITVQKETRDYNISTSLKSYIDPRIYYEWGKRFSMTGSSITRKHYTKNSVG